MSPMTRTRCTEDNVPKDITVKYYEQRAAVGALIVSEGISPSAIGVGYWRQPGLFTAAQIEGWKRVTDAVHSKGGFIFAQLMHAGRLSHSSLLPNNALPVAPSAIPEQGLVHAKTGKVPYEVPAVLSVEGIKDTIADFVKSAKDALAAGFDGIEVHGANGYLVHEFLAPDSNTRTDEYGGSPAARAKFVLDLIAALVAAIGADRVSIKFGPNGAFSALRESLDDVKATYGYVLDHLPTDLAYVSISNFTPMLGMPTFFPDMFAFFRARYKGVLAANALIEFDAAEQMLSSKQADFVLIGRYFLTNPDLITRLRSGYPIAPNDLAPRYWYGPHDPADDEIKYTDYPAYDPAAAS